MRLLEMVQLVLPMRMSMPVTETPPIPKKSKILLLSTMLPVLMVLLLVVVPTAETHFTGRLVPAGPMLLFATTLLLLPEPVVVLNRIFPPAVPTATVDDPRIVQFATMSFWAPLMKRIVLVL